MAEIGIAASVAQFIDMGIRLAFKLSWICSEIRNTPEKLRLLHEDVSQQVVIAKIIQANIDAFDEVTRTTALEPILRDYVELMNCLHHILQEVTTQDHDSLVRRGWSAIRAVHKNREILHLCDQLDKKKNLLSVLVENANLIHSSEVKKAISQTNEKADENLQVSQRIEAASLKMDVQIDQIVPLLRRIEPITSETYMMTKDGVLKQQKILADLNQARVEIRNFTEEWKTLRSSLYEKVKDIVPILKNRDPRLANVISRIVAENQHQPNAFDESSVTNIYRPSYGIDNSNQLLEEAQMHDSNDTSFNTCKCRKFSHSDVLVALPILHFMSTIQTQHYRRCPKFKNSEESFKFVMKIIPPSCFLSHTINIGITVSNWRTYKGFSISPIVLGTSRVVDLEKSPAFRAIQNTRRRLKSANFTNSSSCLTDLRSTLQDLFETKQASALDEDSRGNTLLYEILWLYYRHQSCGVSRHAGEPGSNYLSLVQYLMDSGANPNAVCIRTRDDSTWDKPGLQQGTALDMFAVSLSSQKDGVGHIIYKNLVEQGGEFSRPFTPLEGKHSLYWFEIFEEEIAELRAFPEQIDVCAYGPLVPAILERSERDLLRLMKTCNINHASAINGLAAVHFAVYWPLALEQLIDAGADVDKEDAYGRRPIHLAVALNLREAVELLLQADCALSTPEDTPSLLQQALKYKYSIDRLNRDDVIIKAVVTAIIDRHSRLNSLAMNILPESSTLKHHLSAGDIREDLAPRIINEIIACGGQVPKGLILDDKRVYTATDLHGLVRLNSWVADALWDAGFRQINGHELYTLSPLLQSWRNANFEMVSWFSSKGIHLSSKFSETGTSGLHLYAERLAYPGSYFRHDCRVVSIDAQLISQLVRDENLQRDNCSCLCSSRGCTPMSKVGRYFDFYIQMEGYIKGLEKLGDALQTWLEVAALPSDDHQRYLTELLRAVAFTQLKGQHTCCLIGQDDKIWPDRWQAGHTKEKRLVGNDFLEFKSKLNQGLEAHRQKMLGCQCPIKKKPLCIISGKGKCRSAHDTIKTPSGPAILESTIC